MAQNPARFGLPKTKLVVLKFRPSRPILSHTRVYQVQLPTCYWDE